MFLIRYIPYFWYFECLRAQNVFVRSIFLLICALSVCRVVNVFFKANIIFYYIRKTDGKVSIFLFFPFLHSESETDFGISNWMKMLQFDAMKVTTENEWSCGGVFFFVCLMILNSFVFVVVVVVYGDIIILLNSNFSDYVSAQNQNHPQKWVSIRFSVFPFSVWAANWKELSIKNPKPNGKQSQYNNA